jgi:hypothetical protein
MWRFETRWLAAEKNSDNVHSRFGETMLDDKYRCNVGVSYHTRTDSDLGNALIEALGSIRVKGLALPYLTLSGYGIEQNSNSDRVREDGWVNYFLEILEGSIGMIALSTAGSRESEARAWRGMWVEHNLAQSYASGHSEFILRLEHPSAVKPAELAMTPKPEALRRMIDELHDLEASTGRKYDAAEDRIAYLENSIAEYEALLPPPPAPPPLPPIPDPKDWAQLVLPAVQAWIDRRQNEHEPKASRFKSDLVNEKGYFDPVEVGRTFAVDSEGNNIPGTFYWFLLALLDLYDCVWFCRRCFAASDVWMRTECRPPRCCPSCGYTGRQYEQTAN